MMMLIGALNLTDALGEESHRSETMAVMSEDRSLFDAGQWRLTEQGKSVVRSVVEHAREQHRFNHLQVIGYASPEGRGNRELAARRAQEVRDQMVSRLGVPDECVIVATFSDSHSPALRTWLDRGHTLSQFRSESLAQQREDLGERALSMERRVAILGVYHADSNCRLDQIPLPR
jgi:hypothetical protein